MREKAGCLCLQTQGYAAMQSALENMENQCTLCYNHLKVSAAKSMQHKLPQGSTLVCEVP